jgi:hypothetical protein
LESPTLIQNSGSSGNVIQNSGSSGNVIQNSGSSGKSKGSSFIQNYSIKMQVAENLMINEEERNGEG